MVKCTGKAGLIDMRIIGMALVTLALCLFFGCAQTPQHYAVAPTPAQTVAEIPKSQLDLDREFVAKHRDEFNCASQTCIENIRMEMQLVENRYGNEFGHQYDLCLAYEPTKPKNVAHCKRVFQLVDKMSKEFEDAEAKRKANW
jgi:hypothetical protein